MAERAERESETILRQRYCPGCHFDIAPTVWRPHTCPQCSRELEPWELCITRRLIGHRIVSVAVAVLPATIACGSVLIGGAMGNRDFQTGGVLTGLASMLLLYPWAVWIFRRTREPRPWLSAVGLALGVAIANFFVYFFFIVALDN